MNRQGQVPDHGTLSRYRGTIGVPACRCRKCSATAVRADALRVLDRLAGRPRLVPAAPVQQHVAALRARGFSYAVVARVAGTDPSSVSEICRGHRQDVLRRISDAILSVPLDLEHGANTTGRIPSIGSVRRLRALYAIGVSRDLIAREIGVSKPFVNLLVDGSTHSVRVATARTIAQVYNRLWLTPGRSVKNRLRAQRECWPGPLHWNDSSIDDPDGFPDWTGACGTPQGYQRHGRDASLPSACKPCKSAWARAKASRAGLAA